ncbi:MAG TPA: translation initiation factor IF-5A [Candidatus Norongarragalinales archaeon]|jgi:translation initiation factor 5A|nr:translation initiation factor IF-5A [Candidatus Norongarragalinales archaeon]
MVDKTFASLGDVREGKFIIIDDHPCKIASMDKSKPGKHGAAKITLVAISLFDGSKHSLSKSSDSEVEVPIVARKRAQVVSTGHDSAQLMDLESFETFEVTVPEDMKSELEAGKEIQYMEVMGKRILGKV